MRVSTAGTYESGIGTLQKRQSDLSEAQERLTSGKRVMRASDDPTAAARAERAMVTALRSDATQRAVEASRTSMSLVEGALGDAVGLMQNAREALLTAGNGSFGPSERKSLAAQLADLRQQLLAVANRDDGAGAPLFAGQGGAVPPFLDSSNGVQFVGTRGEAIAASGEVLPLAFDGQAVWLSAPRGNGVFETAAAVQKGNAFIDAGRVENPGAYTGSAYEVRFAVSGGVTTYSVFQDGLPTAQAGVPYASGQDIRIDGLAARVSGAPADGDSFTLTPSTPDLSVFGALDQAIATLKSPQATATQTTQAVVSGVRDLDAVLGKTMAARSRAGDALNHIDGATSRLADSKLAAQTERSAAEDLDLVQALSEFQNQQAGYDAALKAYANVQRLSLFQYLGN